MSSLSIEASNATSLPQPSDPARPVTTGDMVLLASIVIVAALVRTHAWSTTVVLFNDGPVFLAMSRAIGAGHFSEVLAHPYHPLYPFLVQLVSRFGTSLETAAIVVSIFGASIGIVALYFFLRQFFGCAIAWLGAWLLALHPWAVDFSSDVMSDGLYMGFYLVGFAAMASLIERPTMRNSMLFGVAGGLAFLVRPEGLGLIAIGGGLVVTRMAFDPDFRCAARRPVLMLTLTAGLSIAPYVIMLSIDAGELTLTHKKSLASLAAGDPLPEHVATLSGDAPPGPEAARRSSIWLPQSAGVPGVGQPTRNLVGAIEAVSRVVRTSAAALRYEILLFVVIGCVAIWRIPKDPWRIAVFALPILLYSGVLVLLVWGAGYVSRRHTLAAWIPLLGFAALGWRVWGEALLSACERRFGWTPRIHRSRSRVLCAALVVVLVVVWGPRDLRARRVDRGALRAAAEWIAENRSGQGGVAAEKLRLAYYAGEAYVPLRKGIGSTLEGELRTAGARWVVVDAAHLERFPGLVTGMGAWLSPVYRVEHGDRAAIVLEIVPGPAS